MNEHVERDDGVLPAMSTAQQLGASQRLHLVADRRAQLVEEEETAVDDGSAHLLVGTTQLLMCLQQQ